MLTKNGALPRQRPVDRRGYYRSPITLSEYHQGREPGNKGRTFPPEVLRPREVFALMDACGRGHAGKRDKALITVMWRAGLRVSEALALRPKDIDLDEGVIRVLHGKGDKWRTVGIDAPACAIIRDWLEDRTALGVGRGQPVFCVISQPTVGAPMHAAYVRNKLHELGERAGIDKRVHPHGLRHTFAFELAGERFDLRDIRRQLGHSDLATTARYVEHLNPQSTIDAVRARAWPSSSSS